MIKQLYKNPQFKGVSGENESNYLKQEPGIRQGCPLSPYLFVLVMSVMMHDIKQRLRGPRTLAPIKGIDFAEILYADDTL